MPPPPPPFGSLGAAMRLVDLDKGVVAVAFMRHGDDERRRALAGTDATNAAEEERLARMIIRGSMYDETRDVEWAEPSAAAAAAAPSQPWLLARAMWAASAFVREYTGIMRFKHAEVCFALSAEGRRRFGDDMIMAAGTLKRENTFLKPRRFHDAYEWLWLRATPEQLRAMFYFAWRQCERRRPFNYSGMSQCLTRPRPTDHKQLYCAEYVMELVKFLPCAYAHLVRSNVVDLDELYFLLSSSPLRSAAPHLLAPVELAKVRRLYDASGGDNTRGARLAPS